MDLYSRDVSPFAARARVSILAKRLNIRIVDNPEVASPGFGELNALRRIPVLTLDDGRSIPESDTIVEYLEEAFPEIPLRPTDPFARARVRLISRVAELYVFPVCLQIFGALATRDEHQLASHFDKLDEALTSLSTFLDNGHDSWHALGNTLTTADGGLAAFLLYVEYLGNVCQRPRLIHHPRLERFWIGAQTDAVLATVLRQMSTGLAALSARAQATAAQ